MLSHSSDVEVDEMGWITVISHSLLYMESHIRGITHHAPAQANHHSHAVPVAEQEGVQVEIMWQSLQNWAHVAKIAFKRRVGEALTICT